MTTLTHQPPEPRQLLPLLQSQRDGYQQLIELGSRQTQLIDAGQSEQLLALLSKRQALIEDMADLGRQIAACREHWPNLADELGEDRAQQARALVDDIETLLARIIEQDESDRARLSTSHQRTGRELRQTASAPRALGAYKTAAAQTPRFTDRNG